MPFFQDIKMVTHEKNECKDKSLFILAMTTTPSHDLKGWLSVACIVSITCR